VFLLSYLSMHITQPLTQHILDHGSRYRKLQTVTHDRLL
jgi:hypothetical protein